MILLFLFFVFFSLNQILLAGDRPPKITRSDYPYNLVEHCKLLEKKFGQKYLIQNTNPEDNTSNQTHIVHKSFERVVFSYLKETVQEYKFHFFFGSSTLLAYCYFAKKLSNLSKTVHNPNAWSTWKINISSEEFYEIPEEILTQELLEQVRKHYDSNDQREIIETFNLFIKDIKAEIAMLQNFTNFYRILKLPVLSWLFANYDDEFILAQECIERLSYMLDLVTQKAFSALTSS